MYFRQRQMDAKNQLFFNRIIQLPVAKAISDKAISTYQAVKTHNRLFNFSLQTTENIVKYATETSVAKMVLDSKVVGVANHIAVTGLDKVEHDFPVVKKTPDELVKIGQNYYNESWVKGKVDTVVSIKNHGVNKITTVKNYCQSIVTNTITGVLDYTEATIDKYVPHGEANGQPANCEANASYLTRVRCISGKLYYGLKHRAFDIYSSTVTITIQILEHVPIANSLVGYAKNTAVWANGVVHGNSAVNDRNASK